MSYFDIYVNRLNSEGGSVVDSLRKHSDILYTLNFKESSAYRLAKYKQSNLEEIDKDIRVVNEDHFFNKKKVYLLPHDKLNIGDYIYFDEYWWIIEEFNPNLESPCAEVEKCNQTFKWRIGNEIFEYPCVSSNDSYGVKQASYSGKLTAVEAKLRIYIQDNSDTRKIERNMRIMFAESKTDVYKVTQIDKSTQEGMIVITCDNDEYRPLEDDLENNICGNEQKIDNPINTNDIIHYSIEGENEFLHKTNSIFTLNPSNSNCIWSIDEYSSDIAKIENQDSNSCTVYGFETRGSEFFTLCAKDGDTILAEKEITIKKRM